MGVLNELGYKVKPWVIDARAWIPQRREREYLVGFRDNVALDLEHIERRRNHQCTIPVVSRHGSVRA